MPQLRLALAPLVVAALALAGCGSSSHSASTAGSATSSAAPSASATSSVGTAAPAAAGSASLAIAADSSGALKFTASSLQARAGTVKIAFTNQSSLGHNLTIAASNGQLVGATPTFAGGKQTLTAHLKPGTYTFFCSVPGHRAAGMQGTITVS